MLNDSLYRIFATNSSSPFSFSDPEEECRRTRFRAAMAQEERRRQATLEEQAYLKKLDKRSPSRLYSEYMKCRRQQRLYEQAVEERIRQHQRLYKEEMERRRRFAAAHERKLNMQQQKQKEEANSVRQQEAARRESPRYHIVRSKDGRLYRILMNPSDECHRNHHEDRGTCLNTKYEQPSAAPILEEDSPSSASSMATSDPSASAKRNEKPVFKNVTFNISINQHGNEKEDSIDSSPSKPRKVKKHSSRKKEKKPSSNRCPIIVGEVEDASDSECEDEFGDYFHNRRPATPGMWIEPVEGLNAWII
jgi:hypothetical protein